ncbi:protein kinase [Myroides odoratimimus]|uniref:protein kinase domain-containing protein n=1 Tax=Myroides odoratimimus TaxID=76832 RepID=UPI002578F6B9|nr:serine/threonine-protein kinase [Myroides odoratimimus]MDM1679889.1 protein kinase [Myroides odoratimimus]
MNKHHDKMQFAAYNLTGRELANGWIVSNMIEKTEGGTGGFFSVCYLVERNDEKAFLKALDFNAFFQMNRGSGKRMTEILKEQTNAFEFEKELLFKCKESRLSKVSMIVDEGEENLDDFTMGVVPYLIFEIADGDIRKNIKFQENLDLCWKLKSLHDVAIGLEQLHQIEIGHQDVKPSNVLMYNDYTTSKIGDLGRSLCKTVSAPHDDGKSFVGQLSYAPPEYLYGYIYSDWNTRIRATDMYMLGNLITYYFLGVNVSTYLERFLDPSLRSISFNGTFEDVKEYLVNAYDLSIQEIKNSLGNQNFANDLIEIISYCCHPIPTERGHLKNKKERNSQFSLKRAISKLDLMKRRADLKVYNYE